VKINFHTSKISPNGKGKVSDAAHGEAVRLVVVVVHVAVPTVEVQVPAIRCAVLRTAPVVAV